MEAGLRTPAGGVCGVEAVHAQAQSRPVADMDMDMNMKAEVVRG